MRRYLEAMERRDLAEAKRWLASGFYMVFPGHRRFDTLEELRADIATRLGRVQRRQQLVQARDRALESLADSAEIPVPEGVLTDEVQSRRQAITERLEGAGLTLTDFLAADGKSEDDLTAELTDSAGRAIRNQLLLDAFADAEEVSVSDDEFGYEVVHRAQHAGMPPQQYYDQLVRSGAAGVIFGDVRRGKMPASLLERVVIEDTNGERLTLADLRGALADDEHDHDHGDHEGHDHD